MAGAGLTHDVWLERVPELVAECADEWGITVGEPYQAGGAGYTVRADLADGAPAVLKLIFPHREAEHEADALELWAGEGAVRLLARDDERMAMLLERCVPGYPLAGEDRDAGLDVLIGLLPRLWRPAGEPFHSLADEAAWWIDYLPDEWEQSGRAVDRRLVDAAVAVLGELATSQGEQVLVDQDLHGENVLAAEREPWLVIDPKPLVGEREFAVAPIVRSIELGRSKRHVLHRLDRLTAELGLDRERARGWTIGQTMAWAFDGSYIRSHIQVVEWLLAAA